MFAIRKEKGVKPQLLPGLFCPEAIRADQVKARIFSTLPDSWALSQEPKLLDEPITRTKLLDK